MTQQDRYGMDSKNVHRTLEQEQKAQSLCFADCSSGKFLDFEAGVCSVCKSPDECQGWVPYLSDAKAQLKS